MRWKGLFNISEYFMSCTSLEFTPMAVAEFLKKQTNKQNGKNITEQHKHSLKRVVGLLGRLRISP